VGSNDLKCIIGSESQIIDIGIFKYKNKILSNFIKIQLIANVYLIFYYATIPCICVEVFDVNCPKWKPVRIPPNGINNDHKIYYVCRNIIL